MNNKRYLVFGKNNKFIGFTRTPPTAASSFQSFYIEVSEIDYKKYIKCKEENKEITIDDDKNIVVV